MATPVVGSSLTPNLLPLFLPSSMVEETLADTGIVHQLQWLAEANKSYRELKDNIRAEVCWQFKNENISW